MHLHHAVQNNKFSLLLKSNSKDSPADYYTIDFDATSSSNYHMPIQTVLPSDAYIRDHVPIASCDVLVGLYTGNLEEETICFWNPSTREFKKISTPTTSISGDNNDYIFSRYGICYDWKIDDYKLFKIVSYKQFYDNMVDDTCSQVWVCRLGSSSWENVGDIPYNICRANVSEKTSKGTIHWIQSTKVIVSFNVVEVTTQEIQIPGCYLDDGSYSYGDMDVGVLGEDLYLLVNDTYKNGNIHMWVMADSWTKIFSLSRDTIGFDWLVPLHYLNKKNCEILLHGTRSRGKEDLVSYNQKSGTLATLDIPCMPKHFYATTFVGSLVSLNSGEFVKASKTSKFYERAKSGYLEFQRCSQAIGYLWIVYFASFLVLLGSYLGLGILGSTNLSPSSALHKALYILLSAFCLSAAILFIWLKKELNWNQPRQIA